MRLKRYIALVLALCTGLNFLFYNNCLWYELHSEVLLTFVCQEKNLIANWTWLLITHERVPLTLFQFGLGQWVYVDIRKSLPCVLNTGFVPVAETSEVQDVSVSSQKELQKKTDLYHLQKVRPVLLSTN